MDIEIKVDENCKTPKIVIFTDKVNKEVTDIMEGLANINQKILKAYRDEKMYILNQSEIETIYSESGKIYIRYNEELYTIKNRLYELENLLDKKVFIRISNSEIVNINMVENIDFKIIGTLILNFKSGNKAYASRRYVQKIKEFLEI